MGVAAYRRGNAVISGHADRSQIEYSKTCKRLQDILHYFARVCMILLLSYVAAMVFPAIFSVWPSSISPRITAATYLARGKTAGRTWPAIRPVW